MRILFTLVILVATSGQIQANPPLADIFTRNIYAQTGLAHDASGEEKVTELQRRKLAELQTKKLDALDAEIRNKKEIVTQLAKKENFPIIACTAANTALLVLAGPVGVGATLGIKYAFDHPQNFQDAVKKGFDTLYAPTFKLVRAIAPREAYEAEVRELEATRDALVNATKIDQILSLETRYVQKKWMFPAEWQIKIEDLLLESYRNESYQPSKLVVDLVWHPFDVKTYTMDQRKELVNDLRPGLKKSLLTKLTDTKNRHCGYCQTDNQEAFAEEMEAVAKTLGLPLLIIDAHDYDPCNTLLYGIPCGIDPLKVSTDTFKSGSQAQKGLILSSLANLKNISNCILVIKNIDEWTMTGNENLAWILKLFDLQTKTFKSNYYALDVDQSHLNVITSGTTPLAQLDSAFRSRVAGYVMK